MNPIPAGLAQRRSPAPLSLYYSMGLVALILFSNCTAVIAQTNIIDSTSTTGGSFQNTTNTFAANGWTSINGATNKWFVGTVATCTGSKGAYIGTAAANNNYTLTTSDVSHFYRSVTFPPGETCITLSFIWKANGETGYDGLSVYLGSVGGPVPVANTSFTTTNPTATQLGATWYDVQASCGRVSITIPASFAGTTRYLVFSWKNDNSGGGGTGATVDNIGLVSAVPAVPNCAGGYSPANGSLGVGRCNATLSWTAPTGTVCNAPTTYYVYFGPAINPPLIDSTTALSYPLGTLSSTTAYYWKIVPKNSVGLATGCTQRIFTTDAAVCPVSPGGAGLANVTGWFKADALTAGNLTSWTSTYPSGGSAITVTDPSAPYSQVTNSNLDGTNSFNYNQYVSFANNAVTAGNERFLYTTSSFNLLPNSDNTADQSSFFTVSKNRAGGLNDAIVYWIPSSGNYGLQCRGFGRMAIGSNLGHSTQASRDPVVTTGQNIFSYTGNRSTATSMTGYYNGSVIASGTASESQGAVGLAFGAHIATSTPTFIEAFQGDQAEHVFFNATLSNSLMVKRVHTYLAVKYGITLSTSYMSSSGTTIFTTAAPYNNNIIGIGRDDASGLVQKQSHNMDDSVRVFAGTLAATNAANSASISADQSFVMTGATTGPLNAVYMSTSPKPAGIYSRLEREWQVTKTNYGQTFSISIKLSSAGAPLAVTASDLRLLVDNTGNFATAAVYASGGGMTISYSYPTITVSGISNTQIPNNSTVNITIGSISVSTPLPVGLTGFTAQCNNKNTLLQWSTVATNESDHFTIERGTDGIHFTAIAQVNAKDSASLPANYSYTDNYVSSSTSYYRLKQTDRTGNTSYSAVASVKQDCGNNNLLTSFVVYPNPVSDNLLQLDYTSAKDEIVTVKFNNITGQTCLKQSLHVVAGRNNATVGVGSLSPGIYFVQVESSQKNKVIKLVVNKTAGH